MRSTRSAQVACATAVLLAACTSVPTPTAPAVLAPEPVVRVPAQPDPSALSAFEQQHRQKATQAAAQGRWADAQAAWDVVLALRPQDDEALRGRRDAVAAAVDGVAERLPRARQAQRKGDLEGASRLYLEVLALDPLQADAATALRAIESERVRRSRSIAASRGLDYRPPPAPMPAAGAVRSDVEHAAMLSRQGEVDAAIALLQPVATARRADPAARALMADLYMQQADRLAAADRAAAIAALESSLRFVPGHPVATRQLRELRQADERKQPPSARSKP